MKRGAKVLAGGQRIGDAGNFWEPTILTDVPLEAKVFNDEPFGPMAAIRSFDTLEEAIAEANRLPYGLAGYAFTQVAEERRPAHAPRRSGHAVDQHAGHAHRRDAVRRRQGLGLWSEWVGRRRWRRI